MTITYQIKQIGIVKKSMNVSSIHIDDVYIPGLKNIERYSHLQIVCWGHLSDNPEYRSSLIKTKLFKKGPDEIGVFASRSPTRPNPIMISTIKINEIDFEKGIIFTSFIDVEHDTPVLDIKPYNFMDRVRDCNVPDWCKNWPQWYEDSLSFNWQNEIIF